MARRYPDGPLPEPARHQVPLCGKHIAPAVPMSALRRDRFSHADSLRLAQIFNNLLSNAVKFTASGGSIDVTLDALPDGVRVTVRDTGLGIPKNDLPHIFDKYYQAATKATGGEIGGGLGLAIVREAVLAHGGRIDVTSELNKGTAFIVYLPSKNGGKPQPSSLVAEELPVMAHVAQAGGRDGMKRRVKFKFGDASPEAVLLERSCPD